MEFKTVKAVYFSATDVTKNYVKAICKGLSSQFETIEFTTPLQRDTIAQFSEDEIAVIGVPVYFGRVPFLPAEYLKKLKGNGAKAIAVVSYGNRDFDDALLELADILSAQGFEVIGGAAVVGRHSFGDEIAPNRPTEQDLQEAVAFGSQIAQQPAAKVILPGKRPYQGKEMQVKLKATTLSNCNDCKTCAAVCPSGAIDFSDVRKVDLSKCIACHACAVKCPQNAKVFKGLKPKILVTGCKLKFGKNKCENKFFF